MESPANECVVGVDLGGTKTLAAIVEPDGAVLARAIAPTPAAEGPDAILATVTELVRRITSGRALAAVGVGCAGVVDSDRGTIVSSTDALRDWAGTPVADRLATALRTPVVVDNDVNAFAYGELVAGAAAGHTDLVAVTVGTGVGAGVVLAGEVRHGTHHTAGEIGHLPALGADDLACPCGATGHLEAIASGVAMEHRYAVATGETLRLPAIATQAAQGDSVAARILADGATALGASLAGVVNVLDPEVVVLGGGVPSIGASYLSAVRRAFRTHLLPGVAGVPILPAALGEYAVAVGAAALARSRLVR
jgi:glucokinase